MLGGDGSSSEIDDEILKMFGKKNNDAPKDTRYQHPYVELEQVMANPDEYIIPACQPACRALWDKNIETFMVSNNDDKDLYVLLANVSRENIAILNELAQHDPRYYFDGYRNTFGIAVKGMTEDSMRELVALTEVLFDMAQSIVDKVEMGQNSEEEMERAEQQLTVLLAAIQDKVLIKDLVLTPSSGGRTR